MTTRKSNERHTGMRLVRVGILVCLLFLTIAFDFWLWHQITKPRGLSASTAPGLQHSPMGELSKYGLPIPHQLVGPYHVLTNSGYISGYDAGIQDPRWVETVSLR